MDGQTHADACIDQFRGFADCFTSSTADIFIVNNANTLSLFLPETEEKVKLYGTWNFLLLVGVVGSFALRSVAAESSGFRDFGQPLCTAKLGRDGILLALTAVSWIITPNRYAQAMSSTSSRLPKWATVLGIFITISPVLAILKPVKQAHWAPVVSLVHDAAGNPITVMYFRMSGILSAFLDNAPTYLVFFNMAGAMPKP